ncbi:MAG TPA: hypothetical protein VHR66_10705 [Gemmataceae bacterium]|jgi:hypothetical protein|nr:hypothetical protein [Gemmataceae bacterium]
MRIVAYRGASALGVLALFYWLATVRDLMPYVIGLSVFLAGCAAACFRQCQHHDDASAEKFWRLSRFGAWTVGFLTIAGVIFIGRSYDRPAQYVGLQLVASIVSIGIAWSTYFLWFAFAYMDYAKAKRRDAKLPEDLDFADDEHGNAVRETTDPDGR